MAVLDAWLGLVCPAGMATLFPLLSLIRHVTTCLGGCLGPAYLHLFKPSVCHTLSQLLPLPWLLGPLSPLLPDSPLARQRVSNSGCIV